MATSPLLASSTLFFSTRSRSQSVRDGRRFCTLTYAWSWLPELLERVRLMQCVGHGLRERRAIYTCSACDGMKTWSIGAREQLPRGHAMGDKTRGNISVNSNSSFSIVWDDGLHVRLLCSFSIGRLVSTLYFFIVSSMSIRLML
jgi:hypothetical protein